MPNEFVFFGTWKIGWEGEAVEVGPLHFGQELPGRSRRQSRVYVVPNLGLRVLHCEHAAEARMRKLE